jgi:tRNA-dihydrouridine synthase
MMHARNFQNDKKYRNDCIDWEDYTHSTGNKTLEDDARRLDSNLIVQLAGDDPNVLVNAGRLVENSPNVMAIDLNLGCPQKIAKRGNYGAYLLTDTELVARCLKAMVKELNKPVTVKIRRLATDEATLALCKMIEDCGVSMLTLHGRTVENSKLYITEADWDIIRKVKASLTIPVIANGGISCRGDALACLEYTGADAVMSSEALLENPKMFSIAGDEAFRDDFIRTQIGTTKEYLRTLESHPLPRPLGQVVRGHLFKFLFRFVDAPANEDLRRMLAEGTFEEMKSVVSIVEERLAAVDFNIELAQETGLINHKTWYMRHRDAKASTRVLSPRKSRAPIAPPKSVEDAEQDRLIKLDALRLRLAARSSNSKAVHHTT